MKPSDDSATLAVRLSPDKNESARRTRLEIEIGDDLAVDVFRGPLLSERQAEKLAIDVLRWVTRVRPQESIQDRPYCGAYANRVFRKADQVNVGVEDELNRLANKVAALEELLTLSLSSIELHLGLTKSAVALLRELRPSSGEPQVRESNDDRYTVVYSESFRSGSHWGSVVKVARIEAPVGRDVLDYVDDSFGSNIIAILHGWPRHLGETEEPKAT